MNAGRYDDAPQRPDPCSRDYFVSVIDNGRLALALGPWESHTDALAMVDVVRAEANARDPWAHFWSFGTVAFPLWSGRRGVWNDLLLPQPTDKDSLK